MTYKEVLKSLIEKTVNTYSSYLSSKVAGLSDSDDFLADKTEQYRAEYERLDKKLTALVATIKNDDSLDDAAPDDFEEEFIK